MNPKEFFLQWEWCVGREKCSLFFKILQNKSLNWISAWVISTKVWIWKSFLNFWTRKSRVWNSETAFHWGQKHWVPQWCHQDLVHRFYTEMLTHPYCCSAQHVALIILCSYSGLAILLGWLLSCSKAGKLPLWTQQSHNHKITFLIWERKNLMKSRGSYVSFAKMKHKEKYLVAGQQVVCAAVYEVQQSWMFSLILNILSVYSDCRVKIIWGTVIVNVLVRSCLPLAESSHKISGVLFQEHFVVH